MNVQSPCEVRGTSWYFSAVVAMSKSSTGDEAGNSGFPSLADMHLGFLWSFHRGVRPPVVCRYARPLSSRAGKAVSGFLSG